MRDAADGKSKELVHLAHPFGVARRQIVIDRDDVHALAGDGIQINGERGDKRFTFAGTHLGNLTLVQHHAAQHLDVVVSLPQGAFGGFADCCERIGQ